MPGQNTNAGNGANNNNSTPASSGSTNAPASSGTKNQLEQLNTMREALFSQDGWGYQHVNQDTNWEVSVSPEPQQKDSNQQMGNTSNTGAAQLWKPNINNGTELWEANLRNGGQPPVPIPVQKTPWGHTPSTNLGGTWGEDDDGAETSNVWARGPVESSGTSVGGVNNQWGQQHNPNSNATATNNWTDVREIVQRQSTLDLHRPPPNPTNPVPEMQPRNVTGSGETIRAILEQREPIRGDPRGISGRLNGTPEMWGQIPQQLQQQHQTQNQLKVQNPGQWTPAQEKPSTKPSVGTGWEEPSPPPQRRNIPNYDDGTSLWSQQNRWKQQEESRSAHLLRSTGNPSNANNSSNRPQKNESGGMWSGRNNNNNSGGNNNSSNIPNQWDGENDNSTNNASSTSDWNKQAKLTTNWDEPSSSSVGSTSATSSVNWEPKNAQQKVHGLLNMGFKKDDVERALIAANMNFDEALEFLSSTSWRRQEPEQTINYDRPYGRVVGSSVPPQFPPAHVPQKYSGFGQQPNTIVTASLNNIGAGNAAGSHTQEPTAQQLRMLVQQIQMAVQSGYLSSQILNQPLAPATLVLLNQLLTSIKHLQGAQTSLQRGNNMNSMQISLTIAKYKQQITSLQSQINAQQAIYIKQQQQQQQQIHQHVGNTEFIRNHHDALSALQTNFSEINLNKQPGYQSAPSNQQSRLNQWKLPVLETTDNSDFSRAPGATTKTTNSLGIQEGAWSSCRNLSDGWTDTTNDNENKDWPTTQASPAPAFTDLVPEFEPGKPWKGSQMKNIEDDPSITPGSVARSPLSINPMPKDAAEIFTTNQTNKNSPTDLQPLSLSSSTWSFNPSLSNQSFASWSDSSNVQQNAATAAELWGAPINKSSRGPPPGLGSGSKHVTGGLNKTSSNGWIGSGRGAGNSAVSWGSSTNSGWNNSSSTWLLLKNLNNQIDGSTLCTLCKQHGPLLNFQLYLNQGIALCKYTTREEAQKAQMALNNCVIGNTTISVESPNEADVQNILQHFPLVSSGGNNGNNVPTNTGNPGNGNNNRQQQARNVGGPGGPPTDAWSANSVWQTGGSNSSSLWTLETNSGGNGGGNANERTTPSNLKSLLPENLLELN